MYTTLIEPEELFALAPGSVRIFDARHDLAKPDAGQEGWLMSRISGAAFLHSDHDLADHSVQGGGRHPLPSRTAFHQCMVQAGVADGQQIVVYDAQGGVMASRVWWMLRWLGHESVAVLNGGLQAWQAAGLPLDTQPGTPDLGRHGPAVEPLCLRDSLVGHVAAADVMANLLSPEWVVLDARGAPRYRGEIEPLDPVAGHIPGALNRPQTLNLQENGLFKPAAQLREEFEQVLGEWSAKDVVHQCGSGISACHNVLAMEVAGLPGSRLYPGSWSEWCSDARRPVATGASA